MEAEDLQKKVHSLWIQRAICDRIKEQLVKMMDDIAEKVSKEIEQILYQDQENSEKKNEGEKEESKKNRIALYTPNWEELHQKVQKLVREGVVGMVKREQVLTAAQTKKKEEELKSEQRIINLITNYEKGFGLFFLDKFSEAHTLWKEVEEGLKSELGKDHPHTQWANEAVRMAKTTIKRHKFGDKS